MKINNFLTDLLLLALVAMCYLAIWVDSTPVLQSEQLSPEERMKMVKEECSAAHGMAGAVITDDFEKFENAPDEVKKKIGCIKACILRNHITIKDGEVVGIDGINLNFNSNKQQEEDVRECLIEANGEDCTMSTCLKNRTSYAIEGPTAKPPEPEFQQFRPLSFPSGSAYSGYKNPHWI